MLWPPCSATPAVESVLPCSLPTSVTTEKNAKFDEAVCVFDAPISLQHARRGHFVLGGLPIATLQRHSQVDATTATIPSHTSQITPDLSHLQRQTKER